MILRQYFYILGVVSEIAYADPIKSTETEKKKLLSVSVILGAMHDNRVQGYHERAIVFDIPDRLIDYELDALSTNHAKPGARINEIEVGLDIPVGEGFKAAIKCGATMAEVWGTYNYELIK